MKGSVGFLILLLFGFPFFLSPSGLDEPSLSLNRNSRSEGPAGKEGNEMISPDSSIGKIKNGFSAVRYEGDYGFDAFLNQGGAASDREVLAFLRGNLLAGADGLSFDGGQFGCSTISVPSPEGGFYFGRNFDWQKCDIMVIESVPPRGYRSISTVNLDFIRQATRGAMAFLPDRVLTIAGLYAPLDGMNEKGLCVAVNMIEDYESPDQDSGRPDITTTTAIRLLLDRAADVEEALELLASYDFHASFGYVVHFALADGAGNRAVVEYVHNEMTVIDSPILTNFYLSDGDKQGVGSRQSHRRFEILAEVSEEETPMTGNEVRDVLSSVSKKNFEEFLSTEWSIVFDQRNLIAQYYHREDYSHSYTFTLP